MLVVLTALVAALAGLSVALVVHFAHRLPVLIHGLDDRLLTLTTAPIALPLVAAAVWAARRGSRRRTGPERWITVTALVCLCDLVLTYAAHYRYSFGWYAGRGLTLLGAALVMVTMHAESRRIKNTAEFDAATDQLTGLANRRTLMATLSAELARSGRIGGTTSLLMLDLDGFKAINDRHGHGAGDLLLRPRPTPGRRSCAPVICWPGPAATSSSLSSRTPTRFRPVSSPAALSTRPPPAVRVSIGLAVAYGDHDVSNLIATADQAMYHTKEMHRIPLD